MPSSRSAIFALTGIYQTSGPMRPMRLENSAATSGPPAIPSETGAGIPANLNRKTSKQHAERDADEHRDEMRVIEPLERVAERGSPLLRCVLSADDAHPVAELQSQIRDRRHLVFGARHAADGDAVEMVEPEFAQRFTEHLVACHDRRAITEMAARFHQIAPDFPAHNQPEFFQRRARADGEQRVAAMHESFASAVAHFVFAGMLDARNDYAQLSFSGQIADHHAIQIRIVHFDAHSLEIFALRLMLFFKSVRFAHADAHEKSSVEKASQK